MKQKHILTLCFFLLALNANAQQLTATIDSVFPSPVRMNVYYFKTTIHNLTSKKLYLKKDDVIGVRDLLCVGTKYAGQNYLYVKNWDSMIKPEEFLLVNQVPLYLSVGEDSSRKLFQQEENITHTNNNHPTVSINDAEYYEVDSMGTLTIYVTRSLARTDSRHLFVDMSDAQKKEAEVSLNLVVCIYNLSGDTPVNVFSEDEKKIKAGFWRLKY